MDMQITTMYPQRDFIKPIKPKTIMKNLVCFHVGRGGRFNNQGHKTYRNDIEDFQELLRYYADELFEYTEDEDGNLLADEDCRIEDGNGRVMVQGREDMESKTGRLDFDGDYDTTYVKEIEKCTDSELYAIIDAYKDGERVDEELLEYACDATGYELEENND